MSRPARRGGVLAALLALGVATLAGGCSGDSEASGFCADYVALGELTNDAATPAELEAAFAAADPLLDELEASAPPEVLDDVRLVARAYRALGALLARVGYDIARAQAEATSTELDALAELQASTGGTGVPGNPFSAVQAYAEEQCPGVAPATTATTAVTTP